MAKRIVVERLLILMFSDQPFGAIWRILLPPRQSRLGERGVGAVEFALIVPFLLLLIVGIIEMSNVYFMRSQLNEIARDTTRRLAVGALSQEEAQKFALKRLAETIAIRGKVDVSETETGDFVDVSISLSIPFADVLMFDQLVKGVWSSAPKVLTASATMMKH